MMLTTTILVDVNTVDNITVIVKTFIMDGIVMCQNCCTYPAPSISAAS